MSNSPRTDAIWDPTNPEKMYRHTCQLERELSAQSGRWVPVEPTEEMVEAACKMMLDRIKRRMVDDNDAPGLVGGVKEYWKVMLAAAPPAPGNGGEG